MNENQMSVIWPVICSIKADEGGETWRSVSSKCVGRLAIVEMRTREKRKTKNKKGDASMVGDDRACWH